MEDLNLTRQTSFDDGASFPHHHNSYLSWNRRQVNNTSSKVEQIIRQNMKNIDIN